MNCKIARLVPRIRSGFTLLEVLVAVVILGTSITSMFVLLNTTLRNTRKVEAASRAISLGHSKLNELLIKSPEESTDYAGGVLIPDQQIAGSWDEMTRWEALASEHPKSVSVASSPITPLQVRFVIYWKSDASGEESQLLLETIRLFKKTREESSGGR